MEERRGERRESAPDTTTLPAPSMRQRYLMDDT
jgi:hypothetical protein